MAIDETLWVEVRRLYVETDETIESFSRRLGIASRAVMARARRDGWPRRSERGGPGTGKPGARSVLRARTTTDSARDALIRRFYKAISAKLTEWELRISSGEPMAAEERERIMKELNGMIQGFEKVADVAAGAEKSNERRAKPAHGATHGITAADTERMRGEIAERLERLHAAGQPQSGPAEPDAGTDQAPDA